MLIGVDAGALSITDERLRVGVWRVSYNLLRELSVIDTTNEYRLYSFLPIDRGVMSDFGPQMRNIVVRPTFAWSTIQLPIELRRHPVDVFLGLSQMLPHSPSRTIGFVYDLGFSRFPDAYPGSRKKLENQTKKLVMHADQIVAISEVTKKDIIEKYQKDGGNITIAYPGVDSRFSPKGARYSEKNPYIVFVGAIKRGKDVPFALRVFKKFLDTSKKPFDFLIVGGNYWEDPEIQKTILQLELTSRVKRAGFVSDKELPSYYRGASALLISSLWEGFCLPAVEAMASGCPVVYRDTGALPEIVGQAGYCFANEDDAVRALRKVMASPGARKTLVSRGLARSRTFRWSHFAKIVYGIISSR